MQNTICLNLSNLSVYVNYLYLDYRNADLVLAPSSFVRRQSPPPSLPPLLLPHHDLFSAYNGWTNGIHYRSVGWLSGWLVGGISLVSVKHAHSRQLEIQYKNEGLDSRLWL